MTFSALRCRMLTLSRSGQRYSEPLVAPAQTRRRDMTHSANALKKHGWCRLRDLNPRPTVYKTAALPLS